MKKPTSKVISLLMTLLLSSCIFSTIDEEFPEQYEAVIMLRAEFEASTLLLPAEPITETGKIYVKDDYLFINRPNKGFHVFDNSNPSAPVNMAFMQVLGATDLSIKNDVMFINNATDLIAVKANYTNNTIEITKRITNAFPELPAPFNCCYHYTNENEIIINWTLIE